MKLIGTIISICVIIIITLGLIEGLVQSNQTESNSSDYTLTDTTTTASSDSQSSDTEDTVTKTTSPTIEEEMYYDDPTEDDVFYDNESVINALQDGNVLDCYIYGRINTHGYTVASFKTSYVVDGGKAAKVRKALATAGILWPIAAVIPWVFYGMNYTILKTTIITVGWTVNILILINSSSPQRNDSIMM